MENKELEEKMANLYSTDMNLMDMDLVMLVLLLLVMEMVLFLELESWYDV
jgi:hypothetical protein